MAATTRLFLGPDMAKTSSSSRLRSLLLVSTHAASLLLLLTACPPADVGAPCNHGRVEPPESKLVTFPALSCNDLLCVYADEDEPPSDPCSDDLDCNVDTANPKFECVMTSADTGACRLRIDFVLERSMCSKKCSSDADCQDGGAGDKVVAEDTNCSTGFQCARIQTLGKFCCEKLCVCEDDLGQTADIVMKCSMSTQDGCCDQDAVPEACGKP